MKRRRSRKGNWAGGRGQNPFKGRGGSSAEKRKQWPQQNNGHGKGRLDGFGRLLGRVPPKNRRRRTTGNAWKEAKG
jgi:hypothetical protein